MNWSCTRSGDSDKYYRMRSRSLTKSIRGSATLLKQGRVGHALNDVFQFLRLRKSMSTMAPRAPPPFNLLPSPSPRTMSTYMQNVGVKLFRQHLEHYTPPDPLYEYYTDTKGKQRRKKVNTAMCTRCCWSHSFFFSSVTSLPGFPLATPKSSRPSSAEHVASIRASTFAVSVSVGRSSLVSSLVRATLRVLR